MPSSRESSQPRDQTHLSYVSSCTGKWAFLPLAPPGKARCYPHSKHGHSFSLSIGWNHLFIVAQRFGIYGTKNFLTDNKIITDKEERMKRYLLGLPSSTSVIFTMSQVEAELKIVSPRTNALK